MKEINQATKSNLSLLISRIESDRTLLWFNDKLVDVSKLIDSAHELRAKNLRSLFNQDVAVCISDSLIYIQSLIALDGFAKSILILPPSLNNDIAAALIKESGCAYVFDGKSLNNLNESDASEIKVQTTASNKFKTNWILATSGTTGTPKLIYHTLESLTSTTKQDISRGKDYCWGLVYEPTRFAGLQVLLQSLISGSKLVIPSSNNFNEQISTYIEGKVNALSATPSWWRKLLMLPNDNLKLKVISIGGEIVDQTLLNQLLQTFQNAKITHIYASTEAGVGFSVKDGKAGFPIEWLEESTDSEVKLRVSKEGHLLVKPRARASGKAINERINDDGFIDTQDVVQITSNRVLFKGRSGGAINIGGSKVQPEEVEAIIRQHLQVKDVLVLPKKSALIGELVQAKVVIKDESVDKKLLKKEIIELCKSSLEDYKVPALISYVDALEYNSTGKLIR